jgi:hypothetical protein
MIQVIETCMYVCMHAYTHTYITILMTDTLYSLCVTHTHTPEEELPPLVHQFLCLKVWDPSEIPHISRWTILVVLAMR